MLPSPVGRVHRRRVRATGAMAIVAVLVAPPLSAAPVIRPDTTFAATIAHLSEPGGFFWSDNLVSNETSYLHVVGALDRLGRRGGAYLGVGPEQNFSYIARLRPSVAIIIDIRRDNLLLHLLFKAIFEQADTRLEYLCGLYARPCPADPGPWRRRPLERLIAYVDSVATDSVHSTRVQDGLLARVARYGVPISADEMATLARLHREFIVNGLSLTFSAYGRRPITGFPTVRDLYLGRDLGDHQASFLATDEAYRIVRDLERADRIIPVVGDLGGPYALKAIGGWLRGRQERLGTSISRTSSSTCSGSRPSRSSSPTSRPSPTIGPAYWPGAISPFRPECPIRSRSRATSRSKCCKPSRSSSIALGILAP